MAGIRIWANPYNRFSILRVHRSADPAKRTKEWEDQTRAGMPYTEWLREYEICWSSFEGKPVYLEDWAREFHVAKEPLAYATHLPIVRGWDFGLSPACAFTQLWPGLRLVVLKEIIGEDIGLERFIEEVHRAGMEWFPRARKYHDVIDPSGFVRRDTDERSCAKIMRDPPLRAHPLAGIQSPVARRNAIVDFLRRNDRGQPTLIVDPTCDVLISGFDGGYAYGRKRDGNLDNRPIKNKFSHIHDALQYIATRVLALELSARTDIKIPEAKYKFTDPKGRAPIVSAN